MDLQHHTKDSDGQIVFRFPKEAAEAEHTSDDVVPLRLRMRPGTICIELKESGMLVGRHTTADVRLSLPDISRRHCRFVFADGQWEIVDLNSLNGIYVNGERLQQSVLSNGDTVRIASLSFAVELPYETNQLLSVKSARDNAAVIQRIADVLPVPQAEMTQEYRKAC